jgi:putative transposase
VKLETVGNDSQAGKRDKRNACLYAFSKRTLARIRTNIGLERLIREIRRRTRVVSSFSDGHSALMQMCACLRHIVGTSRREKRYIDTDLLYYYIADDIMTN